MVMITSDGKPMRARDWFLLGFVITIVLSLPYISIYLCLLLITNIYWQTATIGTSVIIYLFFLIRGSHSGI